MISAIIYDKVANTQIGMMSGEMRVVGYHYSIPGAGQNEKLKVITEDNRRDQKVIVLTYESGAQQIIPDRGVEKILRYD